MASEQFSLCWDNFHKNMSSGMNSLLESEDLVDVTLAVEGKFLKAHKMVLSVCSPYFKELFKSNPCQHPIVFMKDVTYVAISDLLQFMYQGEVQVSQDNLTTFIKTAEALQIKGLTGDGNGSTDADSEPAVEKPSTRHVEETYKPSPRPKKQLPAPVVTTTPAPKRPRLSVSSNDSQSVPVPITKTEPVSTPVSGSDSVQFKVEPYDQNQSVTIPDDTGDDNFGDDTLDDNLVDDNEDYSMMEGEEPQAGTSTDGTGEGQVPSDFSIKIEEVYLIQQNKDQTFLNQKPKFQNSLTQQSSIESSTAKGRDFETCRAAENSTQTSVQTSGALVSKPKPVTLQTDIVEGIPTSLNQGITSTKRHVIWQGLLEWIEKPKNGINLQRVTKHIPCSLTCCDKNGQPEIRVDDWPQKLLMQLMPKELIIDNASGYYPNSKSVKFHPTICEDLKSLTRVMLMNPGLAGIVYVKNTSNFDSLDVKVFILVYVAEDKTYLGFIPNDQPAFFNQLRKGFQ